MTERKKLSTMDAIAVRTPRRVNAHLMPTLLDRLNMRRFCLGASER